MLDITFQGMSVIICSGLHVKSKPLAHKHTHSLTDAAVAAWKHSLGWTAAYMSLCGCVCGGCSALLKEGEKQVAVCELKLMEIKLFWLLDIGRWSLSVP